MKYIVFIISLLISLQTFSQDNLSNNSIGIGTSAIYFPTGKIIGISHNYFANYKFSKHFGIQLGIELGNGQNNDEFYFDYAKSTAIYSGLTYTPIKNIKNLQLNTSFMFLKITNIFGTKDEILNNNFSMSKFSTFEKSTFYGLNIGFQISIYETTNFIFTTKIDSWTSLIQINAVSLKLQIQYKIPK